jgi:UDP-N-acetylglucosamine--N-acetylmuramyl-(pentapeptide) pyrophosphoryl-undecaprenol N-acetylglucosamine transferase
MKKHILIMAGGTGGHVFPALAVATELTEQGHQVSWMGTESGIESTLVPKAGHPIHYINVKGLRGNGILGWLSAPFKLLKAVYEATQIIKQIKPDAVLGLGGFASGPGGVAAKLLAKPLLIHEQNAIPGMTNQLLAKVANKVMEGFNGSFATKYNAEWVGNPVRAEIESIVEPKLRFAQRSDELKLLVLGGSLGARALNSVIPEAIAKLPRQSRPVITHQCGKRHLDDCQQAYVDADVDAEVVSFIDDMATVYAEADIVICRSGALTVAELAAAGLGSILVPYPYAVDDHQTKNAQILAVAGAGKVIDEKQLTVARLVDELSTLISKREQLTQMAIAARSQAKLGTAKTISNYCLEYAHG